VRLNLAGIEGRGPPARSAAEAPERTRLHFRDFGRGKFSCNGGNCAEQRFKEMLLAREDWAFAMSCLETIMNIRSVGSGLLLLMK
jgi:hypothetical protein